MPWRANCRDNNCACVDCFEVNDLASDPCQKYCETICRGEGKPLFEGSDHTECSSYKKWQQDRYHKDS